jgi:dTDP-4-dehydrorhamnose reductase
MKHILVTGCKGQLGNEIQLLASKYDDTCKFYFTDKDELDITDRKAVYAFIEQNHISIIVNCAAFTAVDKAESNEELCNLLNNIAPGYLAEAGLKFWFVVGFSLYALVKTILIFSA